MQNLHQKKYFYNTEKDSKLLKERDIGFEKIIDSILNGGVLGAVQHSNQTKYPGQYMLHVHVEGKVYAVPCVKQNEESIFLKTIYPSSKLRDLYFPNQKSENKS